MRAKKGAIEGAILDLIVENGEGYGLGLAKALGIGHEKYSSIKAALKSLLEDFYIYEDRVEKGFRSRRVFYKPTLLGVATYLTKRSRRWRLEAEEPDRALDEMVEILSMNQHLCPILLKRLNLLREKRLLPILFNPPLLKMISGEYYSGLMARLKIFGNILEFKVSSAFIKKYQDYINYEIALTSALLLCFTSKRGLELLSLLKRGLHELIAEDKELRDFHLSYLDLFLKLEGDFIELKELKKKIAQGDYEPLLRTITVVSRLAPVSDLLLREELKRLDKWGSV